MDEKQIRAKISEGALHARVILEVVGKPKEYVVESLKSYVKKIKADKSYALTKGSTEKAEEHDGLFSAFAELEVLIKKPIDLMSFCFDYMPASVEIIEPENVMLKAYDYSGFVNDMLARVHSLNTGVIQTRESNSFFIKNLAVLLRNFIVVLLSSKQMTAKELQALMGVKEEDIQKVLNVLEKEGKVKKKGEKYAAVAKDG